MWVAKIMLWRYIIAKNMKMRLAVQNLWIQQWRIEWCRKRCLYILSEVSETSFISIKRDLLDTSGEFLYVIDWAFCFWLSVFPFLAFGGINLLVKDKKRYGIHPCRFAFQTSIYLLVAMKLVAIYWKWFYCWLLQYNSPTMYFQFIHFQSWPTMLNVICCYILSILSSSFLVHYCWFL